MGFRDFIKVAKTAVNDVISEIDEELQKNPTYVEARQASTQAAAWARETATGTLDKFEKTEGGKRAGEVTRRVGGFVSAIPVLSAIGDATSEMAGIPGLIELRQQNPDNPWPLLWLSEALRRRQSMSRTSLLLRAPLTPFSAIVGLSARTAAEFGGKDPIEACERAAWGMALRNLSVAKDDFDAMHIASRIYLARGYPVHALQLAAAAASSNDSGDLALFTVAQAHYTLGNKEAATRAAQAANVAGCSLGNAVLSQIALDDKRYEEALTLANKVLRADKARYFGVNPNLETASRGTLRQQKEKASSVYEKAEKRIAGLHDVR